LSHHAATTVHSIQRLTAGQRAMLQDLERASFDEYCRTARKDSAAYASFLSRVLTNEINTELPLYEAAPPSLREHFTNIVNSNDLFEQMRLVENHANQTRLDHVIRGSPREMLNYDYLSSLANTLRLPIPHRGDDNSLRLLLDSVPLRLFWQNEFQAFVRHETLLDDIPCICAFQTISVSMKALAHLVATAVVRLGDPFPVVIECAGLCNDDSFKADCRAVVSAILGKGDLHIPLNRRHASENMRNPVRVAIYGSLVAGACDFVWLHEYGHLVMGHLLTPQSHKIEFEADSFASVTMFRAVEKFPKYEGLAEDDRKFMIEFDRTFYLLGAALSLTVLCMFDLFDPRESLTHPAGMARVRNLAAQCPSIDIVAFVSNAQQALNPTLKGNWNLSFNNL
jgi:hypothetical protein